MPRIVTNLWFDGDAVDAAQHYVSIFPNSRIVTEIPRSDPGLGDGHLADTPVTVDFELDGQLFTGINGGPGFPFTEAISLLIECADQAEIDRYWAALVEGGQPVQCGWLKDRFGVSWQVVSPRLAELLAHPDPDVAKRVFETMYPMTKIDLAALEAAAR